MGGNDELDTPSTHKKKGNADVGFYGGSKMLKLRLVWGSDVSPPGLMQELE